MADVITISERVRAAAEIEENTVITAGVPLLGYRARAYDLRGSSSLAFAKLVELRRRQYGLSTEDLAKKAGIEVEAIVNIERRAGILPEIRTVRQLAQILQLTEHKLLQLAGLGKADDDRLRKATDHFVARSEPAEKLLPAEQEALEEFVKLLAE